jgi:uncharacterized protein
MKKYGLIGMIVFALVIFVLGIMLIDKLPDSNNRTITGQGSSSINAEADEVSVLIRVETLKENAELSKSENSKISDNILIGIYGLGISKDDVETSQYNIYEEFDYNEKGRKSLGFKTINALKIKLKDFNKVGKVIDAAVSNGATGIDSINFELSEEKQKEIKKEALKRASEDARSKAEAVASGLGVRLGEIVSVSADSYDYRPYPMFEGAMGANVLEEKMEAAILPRDLEVSASVSVAFEVK